MVSTSEQLSQLVFCTAVFNEAIRLKSVAPFLMYYCKVRCFRLGVLQQITIGY